MTGSAALDILIGLFTLYFVMSTLASAIVELISNIFGLRAFMLKNFLEFQFNKVVDQTGKTVSALDLTKFYTLLNAKKHPFETFGTNKKVLHSIDSANFAQTLNVLIGLTGDRDLDIVTLYSAAIDKFQSELKDLTIKNDDFSAALEILTETSDVLLEACKAVKQKLVDSAIPKLTSGERTQALETLKTTFHDKQVVLVDNVVKLKDVFPSLVTVLDIAKEDIEAIDKMVGVVFDPVNAKIDDLKKLVTTLPASQMRNVLITSIQQAEKGEKQVAATINDVSTQVAKWFDGEMERLSDLYKRRSQFFLFFTGLLVAGLLNVNTIDIADALAKNPSLREAVLEQTKSIVGTQDPNKLSLDAALGKLNDLSLPIGWNPQCPIIVSDPANVDSLCPPSTGNIIVTFLGILITGASVALGAPFWFDLLKSLTSRSSSDSKEADAKKT